MLIAEHITKRFPGVTALRDVSMELLPGKVNAIVGENGAGKSTLMKILSGVYSDYEGRILLNGAEQNFTGPKDAQQAGIAIIHQELNLVPELSVADNIFLGRELVNKFGMLDQAQMRKKTAAILQRLRLNVKPDELVRNLKVGQQQVVEIARALLLDCQVLIMDEPTSAISGSEVDLLFGIIDELRGLNKTIVYISHKLDELFRIADRFIVLRDGCSVDRGNMHEVTADDLIRKMVGRELQIVREAGSSTSEPALRVKNLSLTGKSSRQLPSLKDISFEVMKGEVLGVFGLMGAGRTELVETIFGLHAASGEVLVDGKQQRFRSPGAALRAGVALVPEDRKKDGLVLGLDVKTNIGLASLSKMNRGFLLSAQKELELAQQYINRLHIKTPTAQQLVRNLSGGNQQKIVLAKCLATGPKLLMLDEPTRGIDVHAKSEIYKLIRELASNGLGVIMVSSELPEILALSDRILVMSEGKITGMFTAQEATEDKLLKAALP